MSQQRQRKHSTSDMRCKIRNPCRFHYSTKSKRIRYSRRSELAAKGRRSRCELKNSLAVISPSTWRSFQVLYLVVSCWLPIDIIQYPAIQCFVSPNKPPCSPGTLKQVYYTVALNQAFDHFHPLFLTFLSSVLPPSKLMSLQISALPLSYLSNTPP